MVELAIAIGIVFSLVFAELFGFTSAGLVVPGYLALHLNHPGRLAATLLVSLATWAVVRYGLSRLIVLYGRRRVGVTVLVGFVLNGLVDWFLHAIPPQPVDLRIVGYIVPGLIANEALTQGIIPTMATTLLIAGLVRLVLLAVTGWTG